MADAAKYKKKPKKNGFMLFCDDQRVQLKSGGRWDGSQPHLVALCQDKWKALPEREKELYKQSAKDIPAVYIYSEKNPGVNDGRLDAMGKPLADRVDPTAVMSKRRAREMQHILKHLAPGDGISHQPFLFIHFTPLVELDGQWFPCELCIAEYSLAEGIMDIHHKFVHPGEMPVGSKAKVKDSSEQTHKVPLYGFEHYCADYKLVWEEIIDFISTAKMGSGMDSYLRPMYTSSINIDCVEGLLQYVAQRGGQPNRLKEKVFEMEALCIALSDRVAEHTHNEELRMAQGVAEKCIQDANTEFSGEKLRCFFHKDIDDECECAEAGAKKYGYMLSEKLCTAMQIELTENHLPNLGSATYTTVAFETLPDRNRFPQTTYKGQHRPGYQQPQRHDPSPHAPSRDQQREFQRRAVQSVAPADSGAFRPVGRGTSRKDNPSPAPGGNAWTPSPAPVGNSWVNTSAALPGTASSGQPSTRPPGMANQPTTRPPGSAALPGTASSGQPSTRPPGMANQPTTRPPGSTRPPGFGPAPGSGLPATRPPGLAGGVSQGAASTDTFTAADNGGSAGRHNNWVPDSQFPAEDVRELEKQEPYLVGAMASTSLSGNDAATSDSEWETVPNRRAKKEGGRGRGVRGPQQPLRRPHNIRGPQS